MDSQFLIHYLLLHKLISCEIECVVVLLKSISICFQKNKKKSVSISCTILSLSDTLNTEL